MPMRVTLAKANHLSSLAFSQKLIIDQINIHKHGELRLLENRSNRESTGVQTIRNRPKSKASCYRVNRHRYAPREITAFERSQLYTVRAQKEDERGLRYTQRGNSMVSITTISNPYLRNLLTFHNPNNGVRSYQSSVSFGVAAPFLSWMTVL